MSIVLIAIMVINFVVMDYHVTISYNKLRILFKHIHLIKSLLINLNMLQLYCIVETVLTIM